MALDSSKIVSFTAQWAGTSRNDPDNQFDFTALYDDGNVYHWFFIPGTGWQGPEQLNIQR